VTDFTPLIKTHSSARVRRLLASAELDVPPAGGKERALVALAQSDPRAATTNFSGIALGTTVHRLIGAVTLYGSNASPWQLLVRGSMVGAAAGALALATVVTFRWTEASRHPLESHSLAQPPVAVAPESAEQQLLARAARDLDQGHAAVALESLEGFARSHPSSPALPRVTVLQVRALLELGRTDDAQACARPILEAAPIPEAAELRSLLRVHRAVTPATSAR
jgi:hypothetical protein